MPFPMTLSDIGRSFQLYRTPLQAQRLENIQHIPPIWNYRAYNDRWATASTVRSTFKGYLWSRKLLIHKNGTISETVPDKLQRKSK